MTERNGRDLSEEMVFDAFIKYDERALTDIRERLGRAMTIYAIERLKSSEQVPEVINDVLLSLWKSPRQNFNDFHDVKKYIFSGITYACQRRVRNSAIVSSRKSRYADSVSEEDLRRESEDAELRAELAEEVFKAFAALPANMRTLMELHYIHKLKIKDVAAILNMKTGTAHNLKFEAKKKLAKRFQNTRTTPEKLINIKKRRKK